MLKSEDLQTACFKSEDSKLVTSILRTALLPIYTYLPLISTVSRCVVQNSISVGADFFIEFEEGQNFNIRDEAGRYL